MDAVDEIQYDGHPHFSLYKSGRVERFVCTDLVPASVDLPTGVSSRDTIIIPETGVSARLYLPNLVDGRSQRLPILIYYHGGAFIIGSAFNSVFHNYMNSLVAQANVIAVSVNYRLAPEHPVPAAYDDSFLALKWIASHADGTGPDSWLGDHGDFGRIILAGDSAGANIAHQMAWRAGTDRLDCGVLISGVVLIHPYFLGKEVTESMMINREMSLGLERLWKLACPSTTGNDDHRINPLAEGAPSLSSLGCKRMMVCVGERDVLRDRGRAYYERLRGSGWEGEVELFESEGEGHVFHLFNPSCERATELARKICSFLNFS